MIPKPQTTCSITPHSYFYVMFPTPHKIFSRSRIFNCFVLFTDYYYDLFLHSQNYKQLVLTCLALVLAVQFITDWNLFLLSQNHECSVVSFYKGLLQIMYSLLKQQTSSSDTPRFFCLCHVPYLPIIIYTLPKLWMVFMLIIINHLYGLLIYYQYHKQLIMAHIPKNASVTPIWQIYCDKTTFNCFCCNVYHLPLIFYAPQNNNVSGVSSYKELLENIDSLPW